MLMYHLILQHFDRMELSPWVIDNKALPDKTFQFPKLLEVIDFASNRNHSSYHIVASLIFPTPIILHNLVLALTI